jgi:hypothetical protein
MSVVGQQRLFSATLNFVCYASNNGHKFWESGHRLLDVRCWGVSRRFYGMAGTSVCSQWATLD